MSHEKTTEDLNTSVGELANLMNDTFTCCMRNYEALLPYLEQKETKRKIYHKLVQINILLNKLNEELVGLRVEYVTISSYEQIRETVQSEEGRKRKTSDTPELGRHETKRIKTELPFSSNTKCSIASSETATNMQSEKLVSEDTEETKRTQDRNSDIQKLKNIKTETQDSYEVQDFLKFPMGTGKLLAAQTSCDIMEHTVTVRFDGDGESASVRDRIVGGKSYDKPVDTIKQSENHSECVPLQNVESQTCNQESCEDSGKGLVGEVGSVTSISCQASRLFNRKESPVAFTTCSNESAMLVEGRANSCYKEERRAHHSPIGHEKDCLPIRSPGKQFSAGDEQYGMIRHRNEIYICKLCCRELPSYEAVRSHVNGMKHKRKQMTAKNNSCTKNPDVSENTSESTASLSLCGGVTCSLADTVAVVDNNCPLLSMKDAVKLCDLWKHFPVSFQINKKYFRIHSDQVICCLCNQHIGEDILSIRIHITRPSHMTRIKRLTKFEVSWKSANRQLFTVPGIVDKIIPKVHFSSEYGGFFCKVCRCFCDNDVVLNHLTGKSHGKKLLRNTKLQQWKKQ